ncbi:glycosyl hydrolase family 28-related protein [Pseudoalteromonas denitrificans]|uniref:Rhamnogalacturonase A/B/Epimerase-like pectate lyase domain-containing protein n=1 Tax=Pseudoalteromonas denitrificans DSM 6059 TaxID=1123010 RepID=A0A1I1UAU3_9GAMM|nr:glycosyl hydrolase family 28-related protein [Pseudoalteromonas denitrificans]SFD65050.1 hypothetical protein SAMN02745724_05091 [Pseudoalteromonas denitrificans DSM 6059]
MNKFLFTSLLLLAGNANATTDCTNVKYIDLKGTSSHCNSNISLDYVSIEDCGATAATDNPIDNTDDSSAIQHAINYAYQQQKNVFIPKGKFQVDCPLQLPSSSRAIKIYGEEQYLSILQTDKSINVINASNFSELANFSIIQNKNTGDKGKAITIDFGSSFSKFSQLTINGFDKGVYGKWVVENRFQDILIDNVKIGIELHSNVNDYAPYVVRDKDGYPIKDKDGNVVMAQCEVLQGWNIFNNCGWFNNVNTFENIAIANATEAGFKLTAMGSGINSSSVKNSPVGVWLKAPTEFLPENTEFNLFNNIITDFKSESVGTVFKFEHAGSVRIDDVAGVKGGDSTALIINGETINTNTTLIEASDTATINVTGSPASGKWINKVILTNSTLTGDIGGQEGKVELKDKGFYFPKPVSSKYQRGSLPFEKTYNVNFNGVNPEWQFLFNVNEVLSPNESYQFYISFRQVLVNNSNGAPKLAGYTLVVGNSISEYEIKANYGENEAKLIIEGGEMKIKLDYTQVDHSKVTVKQIK